MSSSITAAVEAILAAATTALPGVEIVDGELGTYVADEQFIVSEIVGTDEPANIGQPLRYNETYDVTCLIRTYAGDVAMTTRRERVLAMKDAIRTQIDLDPSLGGVVLRAMVAGYTVRTGVTDKGGSASEVDLVIRVVNQTI